MLIGTKEPDHVWHRWRPECSRVLLRSSEQRRDFHCKGSDRRQIQSWSLQGKTWLATRHSLILSCSGVFSQNVDFETQKGIINEHWHFVTDQSSGSWPGKPSADRHRCRDSQCRKKQIQSSFPEHRLWHPDHCRDVHSQRADSHSHSCRQRSGGWYLKLSLILN